MHKITRRFAPRVTATVSLVSLLLLAFSPGTVSAATAVVTQTANTDCAAGVVEFQGTATGLDPATGYIVEFNFVRQDGNFDSQSFTVTSDMTGTITQTATFMNQIGAQTGDQVTFTVMDYSGVPVATDGATLDCSPPMPTSTSQCKHKGWQDWPVFRNPGDCQKYVRANGGR